MRIQIQLRIVGDDNSVISESEIVHFDKGDDRLEVIGLSFDEAKAALVAIQGGVVTAQAASFLARHRNCDRCGSLLLSKGPGQTRFRTAFGTIVLSSPRFHHCPCQPGAARTFSPLNLLLTERVAPELLYLETRWASLMSYGMTADLLKDVLPIGSTADASTIRRHLYKVANRHEADLSGEQAGGIDESSVNGQPLPQAAVTVGIDGGYVRNWHDKQHNFEVVVGKCIATDRDDRYFGLVRSQDEQPGRRFRDVLCTQTLPVSQTVTMLTDGGDSVRALAEELSPGAVTMLLNSRTLMPYKENEPRRHKIPKARYKIENWAEYDAALRQRGSLTVWVTPEAIAAWAPATTGRRGRPRDYSDVAIEAGLMLRLAFGRPWRQTEGMLGSIMDLLGLDLPVPDHTTFSRRSADLGVATALRKASGPIHVVIDSTGLKVFGAGDWLHEKHGGKPRRSWRKLHLAVDPDNGEILASELTTTDDGDASLVGPLLDQIDSPIASMTADGAYDGEPIYRSVAAHTPDAAVIIPPRSTAVPSDTAETAPTQRDRHIEMIEERGRLGWQRAVDYGKRSLAEVAMFRYKKVIGRSLHARTLPTQKTEAKVACKVLNIMTGLGMPVSRRIA